jgi:hypothetical protein
LRQAFFSIYKKVKKGGSLLIRTVIWDFHPILKIMARLPRLSLPNVPQHIV